MTHKKSLRFTLHNGARTFAYIVRCAAHIRSNQSQIDVHTSYDARRLLPCHIASKFWYGFFAFRLSHMADMSRSYHFLKSATYYFRYTHFLARIIWHLSPHKTYDAALHMHPTSFRIIGHFFPLLMRLLRLLLIPSLIISLSLSPSHTLILFMDARSMA